MLDVDLGVVGNIADVQAFFDVEALEAEVVEDDSLSFVSLLEVAEVPDEQSTWQEGLCELCLANVGGTPQVQHSP